MTEKYWCDKCKSFVVPIKGGMIHPHLGAQNALVCPKDYYLVYLKEENPKELV